MRDGRAALMGAFAKIEGSCLQAKEDGFQYVWVDTCYIGRASSVELSEAINSMYRWYRDAKVCYAYFSDVCDPNADPESENSEFRRSKWFARGCTLQELLAPSKVVFFGCDWKEIGTKKSLERVISLVTGINLLFKYEQASIAQKMSWASKRRTTKIEDMAYCLLGLFDVHMPPIYGEGKNAFLRLQREILSRSDDESIFAWKEEGVESGMLASSPAAFRDSGTVRQTRRRWNQKTSICDDQYGSAKWNWSSWVEDGLRKKSLGLVGTVLGRVVINSQGSMRQLLSKGAPFR